MFDQRLQRKEFSRNDYHQSLERNLHLNALSAYIMLVFALNKMGYISMFDQRLQRKEFSRNDYHKSLERNLHLNALSAYIMLVFALVEAF